MNTKKIKLSMIALCVLTFLSACSKAPTPAVNNTASKAIPQAPARIAEVYGKVKSVLGNEITLQLAEVPNEQPLTEEEKKKKQDEMQSLSPEDRQKIIEGKIKYTGENGTITIPVGTPITSGSNTDTMKEMSLTDIRSGIFLRIWLEGGDGEVKTAEYVRLLQAQ